MRREPESGGGEASPRPSSGSSSSDSSMSSELRRFLSVRLDPEAGRAGLLDVEDDDRLALGREPEAEALDPADL